ncbi:calcium-binding protein [Planctomycetota bacterium]
MGKKTTKKSRKKNRQRRKPANPAKFAVGDQVVVQKGTSDPDFPDIPLGGWVGTVTARYALYPEYTYDIRWSSETLANMPDIVRKRSEQDGLDLEIMTLSERELELYQGQPVCMEQPTHIITRPLSPDDEEDRIRLVLGLTSNDPIAEVNEDTLLTYYQYLREHLVFPFFASFYEETEYKDIKHDIQVVGLLDPEEEEADEFYGLMAEGREGRRKLFIPLGEIEVSKKHPNHQLISDYSSWFWNWR